jgi:hypothetical protein
MATAVLTEGHQMNWRHRTNETSRQDELDQWRLSLHEASHAVANYRAPNVKIESIAIHGSLRGECRWASRDGSPVDPRAIIVAALAGPCADEYFFGRPFYWYCGDGRAADTRAVQLAAATGQRVDDILRHGREQAELIVRRYAEQIRKLARVLLEAGELPGHEVERILAQHGVQRGGLTPVCVPQPQERYFERRNGVTCPTADPDPMRKVAVFERRCDGYMGGG